MPNPEIRNPNSELFYHYFFFFLDSSHSSKVMLRSMTPFGVSSSTRFAMVCTNSWSWEQKITGPWNAVRPLFRAVIASRSKCAVGSSRSRQFALLSIILLSMQRTFSPPESTFALLRASSPVKSIRPRNPRMKVSSCSLLYWRSQSTSERLQSTK